MFPIDVFSPIDEESVVGISPIEIGKDLKIPSGVGKTRGYLRNRVKKEADELNNNSHADTEMGGEKEKKVGDIVW